MANKETVYGLIGEKLSHSISPEIHRYFGDYPYRLYPMAAHALDAFFAAHHIGGLNVTIPYKVSVMQYCDELSARAARIGCVNTIVEKDGRRYGDNTDYWGMQAMCRMAGVSLAGKTILVLGSGATSNTAAVLAEDEGAAQVIRMSRSGPITYQELPRYTDADVLINTTPVGMYPNNLNSLVSLSDFRQLSGVIDVVANPIKTSLILEAEQRKIPCSGGLPMLVYQAKYAAEQFLGAPVPSERVACAYREILNQKRNIVLVGMPGCGKTTLGMRLAKLLNRTFVDTDKQIEAQIGMSIPNYFAEYGEAAFRKVERDVVLRFGAENGQVLATGGGAVLDEKNRLALRQNGVVFWVQRDLRLLSQEGRPLSANADVLAQMYQHRHPLYAACAEFNIDNNTSVDASLKQMRSALASTSCQLKRQV